ncbi:MAG: gluconate 2-dehydrogenase subunit 3 family protein [Gemmatimonadales bacterium]
MERRELIRWLVATAGLHYLDALAPADLLGLGREVHRATAPGSAPRALTRHLQGTVAVAAERILPATETPGATDAGVSAFIDKIVADWYTPAERARFLAGLAELDARSRARCGRDFMDCTAADQIAVLTALDEEAAAVDRHWFAMLKYLTVYGYCTSEAGMRALDLYPLPTRYDGCAAV